MQKAESQVLAAAGKYGKRAGMLLKASMSIEDYRKKGFSFFAMGTDMGCLKSGYKKLLQ
jgi:2-keto-3-deoxy-L-rhamnonate aldolase RhmA